MDDFLIITYTRASAAELRERIAQELGQRMTQHPGDRHLQRQLLLIYQADIKTIDSFCTALLRENVHLLDLGEGQGLSSDFRVLDESEADLLRRRCLDRTLGTFYENLTPGGELLADTMGAGRDDSALAELALEVYGKLQSHASPAAWLERSRAAWETPAAAFDATPYAQTLLAVIRRQAAHWRDQLLLGAERTEGDPPLESGYGGKFRTAAEGFHLLSLAHGWEEPGPPSPPFPSPG